MPDREKVIKGIDICLKNINQPDCPNDCPYLSDCSKYENRVVFQPLMRDALALLKEQEPRILSLREAIEGKNGLEIDPYVFVEIKGREDIFIGEVNDVSHYNSPNLIFSVGECFQINRSFPASKNYLNIDYMKTVRCWTHKPSKEQRKAVKWE